MDNILATAGLSDNTAWGEEGLARRESGLRIETGQTFVLKTDDPENLPSFELLQLSWDLLRIAAICGAAESDDMVVYEEYSELSQWELLEPDSQSD